MMGAVVTKSVPPGTTVKGTHHYAHIRAELVRTGQPLVIGRGAVVGMGAVVTKSVPPGVTVVGNPARALVK